MIHRVGRTWAGSKGDAVSIVGERDVERILAIEERANKKHELLEEANDDAVIEKSLKSMSTAKREALMDMERENFGEKREINKRKHEDSSLLNKRKKTKEKRGWWESIVIRHRRSRRSTSHHAL